jgi:adenosylcobinamide-phosphate synthase
VGFAIVGNFEEAMYGWRQESGRWLDPSEGVTPGAGMQVEPGHLRSAVGLMCRAMVLWLILLALLSITAWVT